MEELVQHLRTKTEPANGRTYGECVMDGEFRTTLHIKEKPKRLSREDALIYYTRKLRIHWANTAE